MAPTRDDNARDKRSVLRPNPATFLWRFCALYDVEIRYYKKKVSKLYCLFNRNPPIVRICALADCAAISRSVIRRHLNRNPPKFLRPAQRIDFRATWRNHLITQLNKNSWFLYGPVSPNFCDTKFAAKYEAQAWATHVLLEACTPDGKPLVNARGKRSVLRPNPATLLKRFCALYDVEIRYCKKKVSKLYCLFNRNPPIVP